MPRHAKRPRSRADLRQIYDRLYAANGEQHWWPGDTRFEIMVGAVLTQNTAWSNVARAIVNLKRAKALTPQAIVRARPRRLAVWIRPSGYFNVKARRLKALCRWLIGQGGTRRLAARSSDALRRALLSVHGIGRETADDILLYAFDRPVFVVDAYTRRIFARLGVLDGTEHYETIRERFERELGPDATLFNEYHALIVAHGKAVCRTRPRCGTCCLRSLCPTGTPRHGAGPRAPVASRRESAGAA